jgi:hypothetical protein
MLIKNLDLSKIIFFILIFILFLNLNKQNESKNESQKQNKLNNSNILRLNKQNNSIEHLNFKKNYNLLMKNIQNQESIIKKIEQLNINQPITNKKIYTKETLDGSKELTLSKTKTKTKTKPQIIKEPTETQYPIMSQQMPPMPPMPQTAQQQLVTDPVYIRDNQVLNDKLYPPLGRTERPQFDLLMNFMNNQSGVFNMYTRGPPDTFRMLGYLIPVGKTQTIDSTLILYGRAKWQNSDIGDFYATSSSKISDIKIPLTQYNCNIRRIWDIPEVVEITGPMLGGKYDFVELPKPDLTHPYI